MAFSTRVALTTACGLAAAVAPSWVRADGDVFELVPLNMSFLQLSPTAPAETGHASQIQVHWDDFCYVAPNVDIDVNNIFSAKNPSKEACCAVCRLYDECHAYTWTDFEGGTCWLKDYPGKVTTKRGAYSAMVLQTTNAMYFRKSDCDMPGNDVTNRPATSFDQCAAFCYTDARCSVYSWSSFNGGTCWMKNDVRDCVHVVGVTSGIMFKR